MTQMLADRMTMLDRIDELESEVEILQNEKADLLEELGRLANYLNAITSAGYLPRPPS
jgi:hypothetical protein